MSDLMQDVTGYKVEFIVRLPWREDKTVRVFDSKDNALEFWKSQLLGDHGQGYPGSVSVTELSTGLVFLKQVWS